MDDATFNSLPTDEVVIVPTTRHTPIPPRVDVFDKLPYAQAYPLDVCQYERHVLSELPPHKPSLSDPELIEVRWPERPVVGRAFCSTMLMTPSAGDVVSPCTCNAKLPLPPDPFDLMIAPMPTAASMVTQVVVPVDSNTPANPLIDDASTAVPDPRAFASTAIAPPVAPTGMDVVIALPPVFTRIASSATPEVDPLRVVMPVDSDFGVMSRPLVPVVSRANPVVTPDPMMLRSGSGDAEVTVTPLPATVPASVTCTPSHLDAASPVTCKPAAPTSAPV